MCVIKKWKNLKYFKDIIKLCGLHLERDQTQRDGIR